MRRGFTLMETLLVVGVLSVLIGFFAPWALTMLEKTTLDVAAERLGSMFQMSRLRAMTDSTSYLFSRNNETLAWSLRRNVRSSRSQDASSNDRSGYSTSVDSLDADETRAVIAPWADIARMLGDRIWVRWAMSTSAYYRLEREQAGKAIFTGGEEEDRFESISFRPDGLVQDFVVLVEQSSKTVSRAQRGQIEIPEEDKSADSGADRAYLRRLIFFEGTTGRLRIVRPQTAQERAAQVSVDPEGLPPTYRPRSGVWGRT
jgi:prepilin-type N-terminal cleavage/methylation domain-containing protein